MIASLQFMPPLTSDEEAGLRESIRQRGVLQPVLTDESGMVIDGHNRKRIAEDLGIVYAEEIVGGLSEDEKIDLSFQMNLAHRQMNTAQKRAAIRAYLAVRPNITDNAAGVILGLSHNTVASVRAEMKRDDSNRQNDNKNDPPAVKALDDEDRREASGRKARGRKPDKAAAERRRQKDEEKRKQREAQDEARRKRQEEHGGSQAKVRAKAALGDYDRIKRAVDEAILALQLIQNDMGWGEELADLDRSRPVEFRLDTSTMKLSEIAQTIRSRYLRLQESEKASRTARDQAPDGERG